MNIWSSIFGVILIAWIAFGSYVFTCKYMEFCEYPTEKKTKETASKTKEMPLSEPKDTLKKPQSIPVEGLKVLYKDKVLLQSADNYNFQRAGFLKVSPKVDSLHQQLQAYLKKNPDKQLKITGQYLQDEENTTKFDNLGLARADQIAQLLIKSGVSSKQVLTYIEQKPQMPLLDQKYFGGVSLEVVDAPKTEAEKPKKEAPFKLSKEEEKLIFSKQNVYFDLASSYATMNEDYVQLLLKYLKANPKAKVMINGHTDSLGERAKNLTLSKARAENVKNLLAQKGIEGAKLITKGEGQDKPVADNNTEAGRAKNRRVEINVQK